MKIAVISDTHGYFDPHLSSLLQGVEAILHAGDVGAETVLDQLRVIAPLKAVQGNVDSSSLGLPLTITDSVDGVKIHMLHELQKSQAVIQEWSKAAPLEGKPAEHCRRFLEGLPEDCRVAIFGHSHEPCAIILGGKLFFNPGAAGKKRFSLPRCFGMLEISRQGVRATFTGLERYNEDLPESTYLSL